MTTTTTRRKTRCDCDGCLAMRSVHTIDNLNYDTWKLYGHHHPERVGGHPEDCDCPDGTAEQPGVTTTSPAPRTTARARWCSVRGVGGSRSTASATGGRPRALGRSPRRRSAPAPAQDVTTRSPRSVGEGDGHGSAATRSARLPASVRTWPPGVPRLAQNRAPRLRTVIPGPRRSGISASKLPHSHSGEESWVAA